MSTVKQRKYRNTVYVVYIHKNSRIKLSTGVQVREANWKNNKLKKADPEYDEKQKMIDAKTKEVYDAVINLKLSGSEPTANRVKAFVISRKEKPQDGDLLEDFENYIENRKGKLAHSSYKNFHYTKNMLRDFEQYHKTKVDIGLLDKDVWEQIVDYMIDVRALRDNTINKHAHLFHTFLKATYPDKELSFVDYKYVEPTIITLRKVEIDALKNLSLNGIHDKVRDLFMFLCETGMRYSDSQLMSRYAVEDDVIEYFAKKTGNRTVTFVSNTTQTILNKYNGVPPKINAQYFNRSLKALFKEHGFDRRISIKYNYNGKPKVEIRPLYEVITSHVGRKTFITTALSRGISLKTVMDMVGTKEFRSMRPYMELVKEHIKIARNQWDI